jgi:hypothetical protein
MKQKKNPKKVTIIISDRELEVLENIQKQEGQGSIPAVIHDCVLNYYREQYQNKQYMRSKAVIKQLEPALSYEQRCERVGGKVATEEGIVKCIIQTGPTLFRKFPVDRTDLYEK